MLQTLLYQILEQESRLYPCFQDIYRRLRGAHEGNITWSYEDLKEVFMAFACWDDDSLQIRIIFLLDALDESDQAQLSEVLSIFQNCCNDSTLVIKIVLASRPNALIEKNVSGVFQLVLEDQNKQDIASLVDAKLAFLHDHSDELLKWTTKYLNDHAQGVFLWVSIIIKELELWAAEGGYTEVEIRSKVQSFPLELIDYYKSITKRLAQKDPATQQEARKMLEWVTYAERPIGADEFWDIIAVPSDLDRTHLLSAQYFQSLKLPKLRDVGKRLQKNCGDLIEIKRSPFSTKDIEDRELKFYDFIQLFHQTVREFLIRPDKSAEPFHVDEAKANNTIALVCARYIRLCFAPENPPIGDSTWPLDPETWTTIDVNRLVEHLEPRFLLSYALKYLSSHLGRIPRSESVAWQMMEDYFNHVREAKSRYLWFVLQEWFEKLGFCKLPTEFSESAAQFRIAILVAAVKLKDADILRTLLETQCVLDYVDCHSNYTPLQAAAAFGNPSPVLLLFSHGASINFHGGYFGTPLQAAAYHGNTVVVEMLLSYGANPNAKSGFLSTPFVAAACNGRIEVARYLHDNGADTYCPPDLLRERVNPSQSEKFGEQLVSTLRDILGPYDLSTLEGMKILAFIYSDHERLAEAEDLFTQVVRGHQRTLGDSHPSTLTSKNDLALFLKEHNREREALVLLNETITELENGREGT